MSYTVRPSANNDDHGSKSEGRPAVIHPPAPASSGATTQSNSSAFVPSTSTYTPGNTNQTPGNSTAKTTATTISTSKEGKKEDTTDTDKRTYRSNKIGAQWSQRDLEGDDFEAALEHANLSNLWSPMDLVRKEYGSGIYVYFKYLLYLVGINCAIGIFGAILYIIAVNDGLNDTIYSGIDLLFLGAFPNSVKSAWYGLTSICMLVAFLAAPIYQKYQGYITDQLKAEQELSYHPDEDVIEENLNYTQRQRTIRRAISLFIFCVIIVVQGLITYGIHVALQDADSEIAAQVLGAMVTVMKVFWKFLSRHMTKYEKHRRKTRYIEYDIGKVFLMRIANVLGVYLTKFLTEQSVVDDEELCEDADEGPDCECPLAPMGQQFFWILIFEISGANLIQLVWPWVYLKYNQRRERSLQSGKGDEAAKQQFDLPEEFTEVLYRQFLIYLGTAVFPLLPVLGVASYFLEYWVDKYRLIYLCRKEMSKARPVRARLLFALHILAALAALFSFPNGMVYLFAGIDIRNNCQFW